MYIGIDKTMSNYEVQYLFTQYGLLLLTFILVVITFIFYKQLVKNDNAKEQRDNEKIIKDWCKCVFETGSRSPGQLQSAGQKARARYPNNVNLILQAYDELSVENPILNLPALYKFLQSMDGVEPNEWPSSAKAMVGKLTLY